MEAPTWKKVLIVCDKSLSYFIQTEHNMCHSDSEVGTSMGTGRMFRMFIEQ